MISGDGYGAIALIGYYLVFTLLLPTLLKVYLHVPVELARKLQHVTYSLSVFLLLELFSAWYLAILAAFSLVIIGYPALLVIEKLPFYKKYFVDRSARGGELRRQLLYVQLSFALLIYIFWGFFGFDWRYVIAVAVMAWGFGDAAAALVGKAYGRRLVLHHLIDVGKTYEGTLAMVIFAGLAAFFTLYAYGEQTLFVSLAVAAVIAPVCGIIELFSRRGHDTITVPITAAFTIIPLVYLFCFLGW